MLYYLIVILITIVMGTPCTDAIIKFRKAVNNISRTTVYTILHEYRIPTTEVPPEYKGTVNLIIEDGVHKREDKYRPFLEQKASKNYADNIKKLEQWFDRNGYNKTVVFAIPEQPSPYELSEILKQEYNLNIYWKKNTPYINDGREQKLTKVINKYIKTVQKNPINKLSEDDLITIKTILLRDNVNLPINYTDLYKLRISTRNLVVNNNVKTYIKLIFSEPLYYNTIVSEVKERIYNPLAFMFAIDVITKKFTQFTRSLDDHLSRNKKIDHPPYNLVYFSIDPTKVATMSTNQSWKSCTSLDGSQHTIDPIVLLTKEIGTYSIVAYALNSKNPEHPVGRVVLKPYISITGQVVWHTERPYGDLGIDFVELVNYMADREINRYDNKVYILDPYAYNDKYQPFIISDLDSFFRFLLDNNMIGKLNTYQYTYIARTIDIVLSKPKNEAVKSVINILLLTETKFVFNERMEGWINQLTTNYPELTIDMLLSNINFMSTNVMLWQNSVNSLIDLFPANIANLLVSNDFVFLEVDREFWIKSIEHIMTIDPNIVVDNILLNPTLSSKYYDVWQTLTNFYINTYGVDNTPQNLISIMKQKRMTATSQ